FGWRPWVAFRKSWTHVRRLRAVAFGESLVAERSSRSAPRIVHVGHALLSAIHHLATVGAFLEMLTSFQVENSCTHGQRLRIAFISLTSRAGLGLLSTPLRRE